MRMAHASVFIVAAAHIMNGLRFPAAQAIDTLHTARRRKWQIADIIAQRSRRAPQSLRSDRTQPRIHEYLPTGCRHTVH